MPALVNDLTSGDVTRKLIRYALPLMASSLLQATYSITDIIVAGHFIGDVGITAINNGSVVMNMLTQLAIGLTVGGNILVGQYFGSGDQENRRKASGNLLTLGVLFGLLFTALVALLGRPLLMLLQSPTLDEATAYLTICGAGLLFIFAYNAMSATLRGVGNSRIPLYCIIVSVSLNVVLDILFVAVFRWGVGSAALATILSQILSASLAFRRLTRTRACYRVNWRRIRFEGPMLRQVVTLGIPSGVQSSVVSLANVIVQANINAFGSAAMAGCGAYSKIEGFAFLPVTCFALALSTFVSQNIGARRFDRVRQGMKFGLICSPVLAELIGVAIFTLAPFLIALFNSDPSVVSFGVDDARTVSLFYCLLSFSHCCAGILRGMGRPVVPMAIMLCVWCALRITYITVTVHFIPDIHVVYWAYPLTWAISSVLFLFCLRRMRFPSEEHGEPVSYIRG